MGKTTSIIADLEALHDKFIRLKEELAKAVVGQHEIIDLIFTSLLANGHLLLEGVPGLGKTLLVQTFARATGLSFSRVQFTPDLMPQDITGGEVIDESEGKRHFRFIAGPVFANIVLADEINRTPPKTQAALLEAMQERSVTSYGKSYELPRPFFVMATQNPLEQEGTYPLPEAQLDRFLFYLKLDYPTFEEELAISQIDAFANLDTLSTVMTLDEITRYQASVREMPVGKSLVEYAVSLVRESRPATTSNENVRHYIAYGAGPRASQFILTAAKAYAALKGKDVTSKEDVDFVLPHVLTHRVLFNFQGSAEGYTFSDLLAWIRR